MRRKTEFLVNVILLTVLVIFPFASLYWHPFVMADFTPVMEHSGNGMNLDIFDFARNDSLPFINSHNESSFTYENSWYPTGYAGYHLHADISNLQKTVDPVPNGNFEEYPEVGNNWTLVHIGDGCVGSVINVTGGNPGSCLDVELPYSKRQWTQTSYIYNNFEYISQITPDTLTLSFDVRYSTDITKADWLIIQVEIEDDLNDSMGDWWRTTADFSPDSWSHISFRTMPVNGSITLQITVRKTDDSNRDVDGHIYFDNFQYLIGSYSAPSEVGLTLNNTAIVDTFGSFGEVDIYADQLLGIELDIADGWTTTQTFQFNSTFSIAFDYQISMYVKTENRGAAKTYFNVLANDDPVWTINYTILDGRPPPGYQGYRFGVYIDSEWTLDKVEDNIGQTLFSYSFNPVSRFLLLDENIGSSGDSFLIIGEGQNYILEIYPQRSLTSQGEWHNISANEYVVAGEYLRILAVLRSIAATGNWGNISVFHSDGSLLMNDVSPSFDQSTNTMTSTAWVIPINPLQFIGGNYLITVAYNSSLQCGIRSAYVSVTINVTMYYIIAILLIVTIISIWLIYSRFYRPRYLIPKQLAHQQKLQDILDIFNDVTNLSRFLVLHRGSGIAIFDPLTDRGLDASLIGGFLQALQAFAIDVASKSEDASLPQSAPLSEITYEGFRVIIHDGKYIRTALVYRGTPAETLRNKIILFTSQFEEKFQQQLLTKGYDTSQFQNANALLEEIFHISLLSPHKLKPEISRSLSLTNLEARLHGVGLELTRNREIIFVQEIVNTYLERIDEDPLEVLNAIFQLREKGLLTPLEFFNSINHTRNITGSTHFLKE